MRLADFLVLQKNGVTLHEEGERIHIFVIDGLSVYLACHGRGASAKLVASISYQGDNVASFTALLNPDDVLVFRTEQDEAHANEALEAVRSAYKAEGRVSSAAAVSYSQDAGGILPQDEAL